jgi:cytoskeletal protein RodZ
MNESSDPQPGSDPVRKLTLRGGYPVADAGIAAEVSDVGTLLCASRMRLGKDLQDIAALLHIRYTYLVAIEDGRFEDLPGQAYALGFVRAYAEHLGLDGDEVVRRFKDENAGLRRKASLDFPMPAPESGIPSGALLLVAVVAGMLVYGVWYSFAGADRNAAALIQEVPARLSALLKSDTVVETAAVSDTVAREPSTETVVPAPLAEAAEALMASQPVPAEVPPAPTTAVAVTPVQDPQPAGEDVSPADSEQTPSQTPVQIAEDHAPVAAEPVPIPATETIASGPSAAPVQVTAAPVNAQVEPATNARSSALAPAAAPTAEPVRSPPIVDASTPSASAPRKPEPQAPSPPSTPVQTAATTPSPPSPAAEATAQAPASRPTTSKDVIELRARSDSWIQVRSGDQLLLTRLLRKGETYRVPDRADLTLMTGNAGGLEVLINGTLLPPLGNEGSVARGVPLDANRLMTMAKAAEPSEPVDAGAD